MVVPPEQNKFSSAQEKHMAFDASIVEIDYFIESAPYGFLFMSH